MGKRRRASVGDFVLGKQVKNPLGIGSSKDPFGILDKPKRDTGRAFNKTQKNEILYQQDNKCAECHKKLDPRAIQFDHKNLGLRVEEQ